MALAVAQVQHTYPTSGGGTTTAATFTNPTTPGNLAIALVGGYQGAPGPTSITDNKGNTWTLLFDTATSPLWIAVYSAPIVTGGATHTVTIDDATAGIDITNLDIIEVSGAPASGAFDLSVQNTGTGVTYTSGSTGTLSQADEIVIVYVTVDTGDVGHDITEDATFTLIGEQLNGSSYISNAAYKVVAATTAINHTWTSTIPSSAWLAMAVTFKQAADSPVGVVAATEDADVGVITGTHSIGPITGVVAATAAGDTSVITGTFSAVITGIVAVTEAADVAAITGTVSPPPDTFIGVVAVTEADDVAALVGTFTPTFTGVVATTEANDVAAIVGTVTNPAPTFRYPVAVSGRKLIDQLGAVYLLKQMSSWAMSQNLTNAELTEALEGVAARHFSTVNVAPCGVNVFPGSYHPYTNATGQPFFAGAPFKTAFGSAWSSTDWLVSEATRLGLTVVLSMFGSYDDVTGISNDLLACTVAECRTYGNTLATRYINNPNVMWHVEGESFWDAADSRGQRYDAIFHGIVDAYATAGRTNPPLIIAEPTHTATSYAMFISRQLDHGYAGGYQWLLLSANSLYNYATDSTDLFDGIWNESGATTYPVWDCEPSYVGAERPSPGTPETQNLRERNYTVFFRGGFGINFGDEGWWTFGDPQLFATPWTWDEVMARQPEIEAQHCWDLVDAYCRDFTFGPDNTSLIAGLGSGDTKAAVGHSDTALLAYFPTSRSVTVNTAIVKHDETAHLDPAVGTATTPDLAVPDDFTIVVRTRKPAFGAVQTIASQATTTASGISWRWTLNAGGAMVFEYSTAGTSLNGSYGTIAASAFASIATGDPLYLAFNLQHDVSSQTYGGWWSADGVTWNGPAGGGTTGSPGVPFFNSTAPIKIGAYSGSSADPWGQSIDWVEIRDGQTPTAGSVVWRFDALDWVSGTSWTDAQGHTWTLSASGAVTRTPGPQPVQLRWYDPQLGTFTTIAASEPQSFSRVITYPSAHPDGTSDFVLVVDEAGAFSGTIAATEDNDVAAIVGTFAPPPTGIVAVTEADDVAAIVGTFGFTGVIAVTEDPDVAAIAGTATPPGGTIATVEADDVAAIDGTFTPVFDAVVAATGGPDVAAIVGTFIPLTSGVIAVTEAADVAAIDGSFSSIGIDGVILVTEADDVVVLVGTFVAPPVVGVIAIIESNDHARITATVPGGVTLSDFDVILGEWTMRRGDRLPLLSLIVESDTIPPVPVDLTDATVWLQLRCEDGTDPLTVPDTFPPHTLTNGWLVLQAYVYDGPNGIIVYDWPAVETAGLTVGVDELVIRADFPDGSHLTSPSDRSARLAVRPAILPPVLP